MQTVQRPPTVRPLPTPEEAVARIIVIPRRSNTPVVPPDYYAASYHTDPRLHLSDREMYQTWAASRAPLLHALEPASAAPSTHHLMPQSPAQVDARLYAASSSASVADPRHARPPSPQPVEHQHRVYVLNCAHCGTFLSDRGMRVRSFRGFQLCEEVLTKSFHIGGTAA